MGSTRTPADDDRRRHGGHPPADAGWDGDMTIISLLVDSKSDPEGVRWMKYFINEAMKEMEEGK